MMEIASILQQEELLTLDNFSRVTAYAEPRTLLYALLNLQNLVNQENFDALLNSSKPLELAGAFVCLEKAELLTHDNRTILIEHNNPYYVANAFSSLSDANLFTDKRRRIVVSCESSHDFGSALSCLENAGILTKESFEALFAPAHELLLRCDRLWMTLRASELRNYWLEILNLVTQDASEARLHGLIDVIVAQRSKAAFEILISEKPKQRALSNVHSLWRRRHDGVEEQQDFDAHYGLILLK